MKKLLFGIIFISNLTFAASKPIITCAADGQVDNDITIELSGSHNGTVSDILRDTVGNVIPLNKIQDRRLSWDTPILNNELRLYVSIEDKVMKLSKNEKSQSAGNFVDIKCDNIEAALLFEATQPSKSTSHKAAIVESSRKNQILVKNKKKNNKAQDALSSSRNL